MTRRDAARAAAVTALSYSRVMGANDRIGMGLIGAGGRGQYVMGLFQKNAEVDLRAICDVYGVRIDEAQKLSATAKTFYEHEKLLEMKEVDAVLIGSPDHWHSRHAIDAMNAGKDVYVEKPLCRTRDEGPQIIRAARVNNRICQVGVQQRSGPSYLESKEKFIKTGLLGRITHVDAVWDGGVPGELPHRRRSAPAEKPSNLDWARFLGPVKYRDWTPMQYFNFRGYLDFNGGKLTDFGHHWMDVVHMFMDEHRVKSAMTAGGNFHPNPFEYTAPDTVSALFEYPGFSVHFSSLATNPTPEYGITFRGSKGQLFVNRNRWEFREGKKDAVPQGQKYPGDCTSDHVRNFLDCVKSRQTPNADVALAYKSIVPPLLAVQSYVEKRRINYDAASEQVMPL
jgi:predicted dehydrogenase